MPVIPTTRGQSVREQTFRSGGVSAKAPIVSRPAIGGGISDLINKGNDIRIHERDKAENIESDVIKRKIRDKVTDLVHNPDSGFLKQKGRDAVTEADSYQNTYDKFVENEMNSVGSDRMKKRVESIAGEFKSNLTSTMSRHAFREVEKYDSDQAVANLASIRSTAIISYKDDPGAISKAVSEQKSQINVLAERKGLVTASKGKDGRIVYTPKSKEDKVTVDAMMLEANSQLQYGVISRAVSNGDDLLAKEYYNEAKKSKQIDGDTTIQIEKMLHASNTKGESQRQASRILEMDVGMGESLEEARKIEDPEVQDATVRRVKNRLNEKKLVEREAGIQKFNGVVDELERFKTLDHVPPQELAALNKEKKYVLGQLMEMISKGHEPKTDPRVHQDLWIMASDPRTRDKFLSTDINDYAHKLSTTDRKQLLKMRADMASGKGSNWKKKQKLYFSNTAVINNHLKGLALKDKSKEAVFKSSMMNEVMRREEAGEEVSQGDTVKIMDDLTKEIVSRRVLWMDFSDPLYELESEDQATYFENVKRK